MKIDPAWSGNQVDEKTSGEGAVVNIEV